MGYFAEIADLDRKSVLHPSTYLKEFASGEGGGPTIIESGAGVFIKDAAGKQYLDGFSGLYCVNVGYGRTEIADAIAKQAQKIAYYHSYVGHTTDELAKLSARLVEMAPGEMSKVFYGLSGSDANETQAKLVWYYHNLRGLPRKKKIIARDRGYHGCSVMSGSLTGMAFYHNQMDLPISGVLRTGAAYHYMDAVPGETEEQFSDRRAAELEALILKADPDTVGAFIAEPVMGTGGIVPAPSGYWTKIQAVLKKYDVLLIADEVITGFGRTGRMFGSELYGIEPDLITVAKGLTCGYVPLSASIISQKVYQVLEEGSARFGSFPHGYTYTGHPLGAAAANAVLDIIERDGLVAQAERRGAYLLAQLKDRFSELPIVAEVRGVGLLAAIEFSPDPANKTAFDPALHIGARIAQGCRDRGLIARGMPERDILGFAPAFIVSELEIDQIVDVTDQAVRQVMNQLASKP
ncbi:adenosylmethionine-8-amino-7-oxononanoate aminotransferase [Pseudomonas sp. GM84]|uniref:aminotransferase n=1 Tax=Pseudomonas sp. GM84 TaxID=1144340 RepID=UPI00026F4CD1|nr:aminotransferase [Pseudomonas sp. GM84]EJN39655.1 adenosylmethionine-8-amino-7-oxononanoate aminotransferase [Pseudomonas sp. GM84]